MVSGLRKDDDLCAATSMWRASATTPSGRLSPSRSSVGFHLFILCFYLFFILSKFIYSYACASVTASVLATTETERDGFLWGMKGFPFSLAVNVA